MAVDAWLNYNGVELVNLSRTVQLADALGIDTVWTDPSSVAWIQEALGGADYDVITNAPWYDAGYPASAEFAGIIPLSLPGLDDSSVERDTVQYIGDGGSSGTARNSTQALVANFALIASTDRGVEYGKRWLDMTVKRGGTRLFCSGADLTYFRYAGGEGQPVPPTVHRRDVNLTRGASVTRKRSTHCSATWLVTFTWTANDPYEYGDDIPVITSLGGAATNVTVNPDFATDLSSTSTNMVGVTRVVEGGLAWASLPYNSVAGTNYFYAFTPPPVIGAYYAARFTAKGTPGTVFFALTSDNIVGAFTPSTNITIPASGQIDVSLPASKVIPSGSTALYIGLSDPTAPVKVTHFLIGRVAASGDEFYPPVTGPGVTTSGIQSLVQTGCPVFNYMPVYDPLHPALVAPPTAPDFYPEGWDIQDGDTFSRYWTVVSPVEPSTLGLVPVITLTSASEMRTLRVSIWPGDTGVTTQCDPLWTAIITYLPPSVQFVIDGEQKATYVWDGVSPLVRRADSLVYGTDATPLLWTTFNDPSGYLVALDTFTPGSARLALSMVPKSD